MNHACLLLVTLLFFGTAVQAAFAGDWPLVAYGLAAAVLQVSVIMMAAT